MKMDKKSYIKPCIKTMRLFTAGDVMGLISTSGETQAEQPENPQPGDPSEAFGKEAIWGE